jgi:hypothetical protein
MTSSGILRGAALLRTDVSEERSASIIRVTKIGELGVSKHKKKTNILLPEQEGHVRSYWFRTCTV